MTGVARHQKEENELDDLWTEIRKALRSSNARAFDGNDNFKKVLNISTCVLGTGSRRDVRPEFVLEAKVPRSAVNDLLLSEKYETNSRTEAAKFLRELAKLVEANQELDEDDNEDEDEVEYDE